jgi:hypothetical protein
MIKIGAYQDRFYHFINYNKMKINPGGVADLPADLSKRAACSG